MKKCLVFSFLILFLVSCGGVKNQRASKGSGSASGVGTGTGTGTGTGSGSGIGTGTGTATGSGSVAIKCKENEHLENDKCMSNQKDCDITGGEGRQVWDKENQKWNDCLVQVCKQGLSPSSDRKSCVKTKCEAGNYIKDGKCEPCAKGNWCLEDKSFSCSKGFFNDETGKTKCKSCPDGSFQDKEGQAECKKCGSGTKPSPKKTECLKPCVRGEYSKDGKCESCEVGHYCPGDATKIVCPKGTESDQKGNKEKSDCKLCKENYFKASAGAESCKKCPDSVKSLKDRTGCFCKEGEFLENGKCSTCPKGHFCKDGKKTACSAGHFNASEGKSKESDCLSCPSARVQKKTGQSSCDNCPTGLVANTAKTGCICQKDGEYLNNGSCVSCNAGFKCVAGKREACKPGTFSAKDGASSCTKCPYNQIQEKSGQSFCSTCPSRWNTSNEARTKCDKRVYCSGGYYRGNSRCNSCRAGNYCQNDQSKPCKAGTYSGSRATQCIKCPVGSIAKNPGSDSCDKCPNGQIASADGRTCIKGCKEGQYYDYQKLKCETCPAGSICDGAAKKECLTGSFSGAGSAKCTPCSDTSYQNLRGQAACLNCPAGTKSNKDRTRCICKDGFFFDGNTCVDCPKGHYCNGEYKYSCPSKTYNPKTNASKFSDCLACGPNSYQPLRGQASCEICPKNAVYDFSSKSCKCSGGYYKDGQGQCPACPVGFSCQGGQKEPCKVGTYSDKEGTAYCSICKENTYQEFAGQSSCKACPSGYKSTPRRDMCYANCNKNEFLDNNYKCVKCSDGYSCDGTRRTRCSAGSYGKNGECKPCPFGTAQQNSGRSSCYKCDADEAVSSTRRYCVSCDSRFSQGYYLTKVNGKDACLVCPKDHFCRTGKKTACGTGTHQPKEGQSQCVAK